MLVAIEMLGALGQEVTAFIGDHNCHIDVMTNEPHSSSFLFQRLSDTIQRGDAGSVTGTSPVNGKLYL